MIFCNLLFASCAGFTTPVAVLPKMPEHADLEPTNVGFACGYRILWVLKIGDSHVREAKKNGGISDIATVEVKHTIYPLGLVQKQCVEVSGYS